MITGAIENQVDQIWNTFCSGGVFNPLPMIEQIQETRTCQNYSDQ